MTVTTYLHPGKRLGTRYELEELLGTGQFGQVWRARRLAPPCEGPVAVKLPLDPRRGEEVLMADGRNMKDVPPHPGIVRITWDGWVGTLWVVEMDYVNGQPLSALMENAVRWSTVTFEDILRWFSGVADALDHLHRNRVVHGDIKPDNLLLDEVAWRLKLTDFGTSRRLTDHLISTPRQGGAWAYQAPEIHLANQRGAVSDLFSVGAVLYHVTTGRLPRPTIQELLTSAPITRPRQYNPAIPVGLEEVIMRLLEDDPRHRLPDAAALKEQLERLSLPEPHALPTPSPLPAGAGHLDVARALLAEGRKEEARRAASTASLRSTGLFPALELFARLSDELGYHDDAVSAYRKLLQLGVVADETRRSLEMAFADLLVRMRRYEEARQHMEAALRADPTSFRVRFKAAVVLGACNLLERALELLDQLAAERPGEGAVLEKRAWVQWLLHRYEDAAQTCRDVLEVMPDCEVCLRRLVEYETLMGNPRRADFYRSRLERVDA
jgi:tetratricopeptide (TPR) repeat protein